MTRAGRVWLIAACYGLWAGLCAVAAFAIIIALWSSFSRANRNTFGELVESLPYAAFTTVVAALGWAILHLRNRKPNPGAYIALAIAIVIVVHFALSYDIALPGTLFPGLFLTFLIHFWLALPIAISATGLFVWYLNRRKAL
jgi:hypothetical protein